jgi:hypothetical protein
MINIIILKKRRVTVEKKPTKKQSPQSCLSDDRLLDDVNVNTTMTTKIPIFYH